MPESHLPQRKVTVERNTLRFSAAHFTTFAGQCEPLHGHNYDVLIEITGDLTDDAWVFDFVALKKLAKAICDELDHRFILQLHSRVLTIRETTSAWEIAFGERCYTLPKSDVCALPLDNSTAERLAEWFADRLRQQLRDLGAVNLTSITVAIEEAPGQAGWCTLPF